MEDQTHARYQNAAVDRLLRLPSGRHYGASADSGCWVMVGRELVDVTSWSIVPPDASLTLAWRAGGCSVEFAGGRFDIRPGECMWIDAGFAHRGENTPGSDFLTIFIPPATLPPRRSISRRSARRLGPRQVTSRACSSA